MCLCTYTFRFKRNDAWYRGHVYCSRPMIRQDRLWKNIYVSKWNIRGSGSRILVQYMEGAGQMKKYEICGVLGRYVWHLCPYYAIQGKEKPSIFSGNLTGKIRGFFLGIMTQNVAIRKSRSGVGGPHDIRLAEAITCTYCVYTVCTWVCTNSALPPDLTTKELVITSKNPLITFTFYFSSVNLRSSWPLPVCW